MATRGMDENTKKILLIGAGGAVLYFGILSPLLKMLGLQQKPESADLDRESGDPSSFWSPNFWRTQSNAMILTVADSERMVTGLYDAFGAFDDCEECAIALLKSLRYQTQLSYLAEKFQARYGFDLLSFLRGGLWPKDRLSDFDVFQISEYIKKLPVK